MSDAITDAITEMERQIEELKTGVTLRDEELQEARDDYDEAISEGIQWEERSDTLLAALEAVQWAGGRDADECPYCGEHEHMDHSVERECLVGIALRAACGEVSE